MYLYLYLYPVLSIVTSGYADCGCKLNRNDQCGKEVNPSEKYSQESNGLVTDNNESQAFDPLNMVLLEKATFEMGTNKPIFESDHEGPARNVTVNSFYLDKYEVSNQHFNDFVKKTGYKTEAEIFGDSFIFEMSLPEEDRDKYQDVRAAQAPWWIKLKGVSWKHPEGPGSTIEGIEKYL